MLTHLSLASLLWDMGKQHSPRCDAAERGVPSRAILFALRIFIEKLNKVLKSLLTPQKLNWTHANDKEGKILSSNMGKDIECVEEYKIRTVSIHETNKVTYSFG